jgi:hypothetical protein
MDGAPLVDQVLKAAQRLRRDWRLIVLSAALKERHVWQTKGDQQHNAFNVPYVDCELEEAVGDRAAMLKQVDQAFVVGCTKIHPVLGILRPETSWQVHTRQQLLLRIVGFFEKRAHDSSPQKPILAGISQ